MSAQAVEPYRSLPEHLCRTLHAYEWRTSIGRHGRYVARTSPCGECLQAASEVDRWLDHWLSKNETVLAVASAWQAPKVTSAATRARNVLARILSEVRR